MVEKAENRRVFLAAEWRDLILCNFPVPDSVLTPYLPPGVELDRFEGSAYVSLVAFDFLNTKVMGFAWPGYVNFAEINLRFYVKKAGTRGVVFVREIVPQRLTVWIARLLYNEPYVAAPIRSTKRLTPDVLEKAYTLRWKGKDHELAAFAEPTPHMPPETGTEHFFKEHEWGFGRSRRGETTVYRVEHPFWNVHKVKSHRLSFDFAEVYGPQWAFLNGKEPSSVLLAEGSGITVFAKD